jgi:two-component system sensor kinase FixL
MSSKQHPAHLAAAARRPRTQQRLEYRAILDAAVDAIVIVDHEGRIQEFSRAAERVFGYLRDEIVGRNVTELMPEPNRSQHDSYMRR